MIKRKVQHSHEIVDVSPFLREVYPQGTREKGFIWPHSAEPYRFCEREHPYLFKLSRDIYPEQYWIEIFAYQLGCLIGVSVPPAFVACDSETGRSGVLIEWFFDLEQETSINGGDIMQALIPNYDRKKGTEHNLTSIFEHLSQLKWEVDHWQRDWAKMLTFDALLGNTDRHQDNWEVIRNKSDSKEQAKRIAPAFDNGTSMGIELQEFTKFRHPVDLERFVSKGKPHLQWDLTENRKNRRNHEDFIRLLAQTYPHLKSDMASCLTFSVDQVQDILEGLRAFNVPHPLSEARAHFMLKLLCFRQERLKVILD